MFSPAFQKSARLPRQLPRLLGSLSSFASLCGCTQPPLRLVWSPAAVWKANRLGIAHSTGYPLYTMLGYGTARLGEPLPLSGVTLASA
jgi:hypothetical protein